MSRGEPRRAQIFQLYAFLGRYAHQQIDQLDKRTMKYLMEFAEQVGELIEEEAAASRIETDG